MKACVLQEEGNLLELVDPSLGLNYSKEEVMRMLHIALLCTNLSPTLRPSMSSVVSMLEGKIAVEVPISNVKRNAANQDARLFQAFEMSQESITSHSTSSQGIQMQRSMIIMDESSWPIDSSSTSTQNKDGTREFYSSTESLLRE